jgi:hypothetical protein
MNDGIVCERKEKANVVVIAWMLRVNIHPKSVCGCHKKSYRSCFAQVVELEPKVVYSVSDKPFRRLAALA